MANDRTVVCICFILAWQMINPGLQTVLSTLQVTDFRSLIVLWLRAKHCI